MNFDDCGSCREPAQSFEERYSGGFYWEYRTKEILHRSIHHTDLNRCQHRAQIRANRCVHKVDIMGILHNGESELIETVEPGVME